MKEYKLYTTVGIIETNNYGDKTKYVLHREDGPSFIDYNGDGSIYYEQWYINGVKHRKDGPARIGYNEDGSIKWEEWRINGVVHREDGPAFMEYNEKGSIWYEEWWWCGLHHRHDYTKPASTYNSSRYYWWYGVYCTPEQLLDKDFRDRIQLEQLG